MVLNSILLYLPVILFWRFVLWYGEPDGARFVLAFKIFSLIALTHIYILVNLKSNVDRFALATDIWLIVCGFLSWLALWDALRFFGQHLSVTGYWLIVFLVAVITSFWFKGGLIGAGTAPPESVRKYSVKILALIFVVLIASYGFRDETLLVATLPTILFSYLSKFYCKQFQKSNI